MQLVNFCSILQRVLVLISPGGGGRVFKAACWASLPRSVKGDEVFGIFHSGEITRFFLTVEVTADLHIVQMTVLPPTPQG